MFSKVNCLRAVELYSPRVMPCYTFGQKTAVGYLLTPEQVMADMHQLDAIPWHEYDNDATQSDKGQFAHDCFESLAAKFGRSTTRASKAQDISGIDYFDDLGTSWQVKLDYRGGNPNLYIQIAEANPTGQH